MTDDRRKNYRFPPVPEQQDVFLRWEDRNIPVRVIDESATGCGVLLEEKIAVEKNQQLFLYNNSGWYEVRVANLKEMQACLRLGLEYLADIPEPYQQAHPLSCLWGSLCKPPAIVWKGAVASAVLLIGIMCLVAWVSSGAASGVFSKSVSAAPDGTGQAVDGSWLAPNKSGDESSPDDSQEAEDANGGSHGRWYLGSSTRTHTRDGEGFRAGVRSGPLPEVPLKLTDKQRQRLQQMLEETSGELARQVADLSDEEIVAEALRLNDRRARQILTDQPGELGAAIRSP
jgi:hypothetical protein